MMLRGQSTFKLTREVVAFIDDTPGKIGTELAGIPVLSFPAWAETCREWPCVVSSGTAAVRRRLVERVLAAGGHFERLYPSIELPYLAPEIGAGSVVAQGVFVGPNVRIGDHVQVLPITSLGHDVWIGDFATVCPGCTISGHVTIEEGAFIGAGATVLNGSGARPLVLGRDCVVAAGAVVTKPVASGVRVAGNPARPLRDLAADRIRSRRAAG
jgi:sugar O-acyltransferase (sialic acid O-acetyltransferase NeuD family)